MRKESGEPLKGDRTKRNLEHVKTFVGDLTKRKRAVIEF